MPQPEQTMSSAAFQAALADYARNPELPPPPGIAPERLAVYARLLRNNINSFLDLCFSDSQNFADETLWQDLCRRFLAEAAPESPFFNDIPAQFLAFAQQQSGAARLPENVLAMMQFETDLLHAETAPVPQNALFSDGLWLPETALALSPAARLRHYDCDFVSSSLAHFDDEACTVLTWRGLDDEVYYRRLADTEVFLLEHFSAQNDSLAALAAALQELTGSDRSEWLQTELAAWLEAGVLVFAEA
ncbi:MAG: putative DNA-binding domain-containing protein [Neisseria sp.]|nr:putative DNA-binding domain-containing protein [Neisseria sp.]